MYRQRRSVVFSILLVLTAFFIVINTPKSFSDFEPEVVAVKGNNSSPAIKALGELVIKGRSPKTDYSREKFGESWTKKLGCDTRNIILNRDLTDVAVDSDCNVVSGLLADPYTGKVIQFIRGENTSSSVQIDHVVALSDAWQKGAQQFDYDERVKYANDPLVLLAVDGAANQQKSDGDAATWLPSNKSFRCQYIARQITIKQKYGLWVTQAEYDAMNSILQLCPNQLLPSP